MSLLEKIFGDKKSATEKTTELARAIGAITDGITQQIFIRFGDVLHAEPAAYIVPAVWGTPDKGELSAAQKQIHSLAAPAVKKIMDVLGIKGLSAAQDFALGFLIRGLIVSKITYMIAASGKVSVTEKKTSEDPRALKLEQMEPLGHA